MMTFLVFLVLGFVGIPAHSQGGNKNSLALMRRRLAEKPNIFGTADNFSQGQASTGFNLQSMSGCSKSIQDGIKCGWNTVNQQVQIWIGNLSDAWKCATSVHCCGWWKGCRYCPTVCNKWTCHRNQQVKKAKTCQVTSDACKNAMNKLGSRVKSAIMGKIPKQLKKVMEQLGGNVSTMMKKIWESMKGLYNRIKNDQRTKAIFKALEELKVMYKTCITDQGVSMQNFVNIIKNALFNKKEDVKEINMGNIMACIATKAKDRQAFWITEYTTGVPERRRLHNGGVATWTPEEGSSILVSFGGGGGKIANIAFSFDFYIRIKDLISPNFSELDFGFYTSKTGCIGLGGIGAGIGLTIQYFHALSDIPGHSVDFAVGGGSSGVSVTAHLTWALPSMDFIGIGADIGVEIIGSKAAAVDEKEEDENMQQGRRRLGVDISLMYCFCLNDFTKGMIAGSLKNSLGYEGCFSDDASRDLKEKLWKNDKMTAGKCITHCANNNYKYAGVQAGKECRCGNDYRTAQKYKPIKGPIGCATNCGGNFFYKCGGPLENDIYQTNADRDVPIVNDYKNHKNRFPNVEEEEEEAEAENSSNYAFSAKIVGFSFAGALLLLFVSKFRNRNKLTHYEMIPDV